MEGLVRGNNADGCNAPSAVGCNRALQLQERDIRLPHVIFALSLIAWMYRGCRQLDRVHRTFPFIGVIGFASDVGHESCPNTNVVNTMGCGQHQVWSNKASGASSFRNFSIYWNFTYD